MRAILFVLLAATVAACGGSTTPAKGAASAQSGAKAKGKGAKLKKKRPPYEPPPLESLPDLGEIKANRLASVGTSLKKLCPAPRKKGKAAPGGCVCLPAGEASSADAWEDNSASCSAAAEGLKAPLQNVQFLASQEVPRRKKGTEGPALIANFRFLFQTKKGWFAAKLGTAEKQENSGYGRTLKLVSTDFVDFSSAPGAGSLSIFEEQIATEEGAESQPPRAFAVACVATDAKKLACTEPLALGEPRKKGGYQLRAVVEEGHLYLVETDASTPEELKSRQGKYALVAP